MKKILLTLVLLIGIVVGLFAQKLTYQAVIRDNNQQLVVNTAVKATVTITFTTGVPYAEEVNGSTNVHGLLSFEFGDGTLNGRDWTGATIAVKVVKADDESTVYVNDDARSVSAVPYALSVNGQSIQQYLTEHNYVTQTQVAGQIHDSIANIGTFTEQQVLSISTDTIYLTGGSFVKLPAGFSGNYNDLTNTPTIPTVPTNVSAFNNDAGYITSTDVPAQVNADWNATSGTAQILNKPELFSGNYNDLSNKPTIPAAANNATLTIQKNGTSVGTFTADASSDKSINITVPTTTSELTNNSGFITTANVPTNVSQLNNDAGYVSNSNCPTVDLCELYNMMTSLQNTIARQDSVINALNNELHPFVCGTSTVTDHEGNVYNTVQVGDQCWTKENMRCTTSPSTGTNILEFPASSYTYSGKKAYYPNDNASNVATYGLLYNWCAAVDTFNTAYGETSTNTSYDNAVSVTFSGNRRGICPQGWHVPSDAEWTQLTTYVGSQSAYQCGGNSTNIAKALASTTGWSSNSNDYVPGNDPSTNNATGFSAVPAGYYYGSFDYFGYNASFWSATQYNSSSAYYRYLDYNSTYVNRYRYTKYYGFSVRCLRDGGVGGAPATNESGSAGNAGCSSDSGCCTELGARMDSLQNVIANLQNTVSSQDSVINALNNELHPFVCGTSTVTDHEGNVYNTVQIGDQCWTRENMRCTTSPSTGTSILEYPANGTSYTGKKAYYPNGNASNVATYGLLYNWCAAVDTFNTAYGETSTNTEYSNAPSVTFGGNRRGICPVGWHVPSDAEWTQLENYVGSQSAYQCGGNSTNIAKSLASTTGWSSNSNDYVPGNDPSTNNATGFSAVPAGYYYGSFDYFGYNASFWSATQYNSSSAYYRYLDYNSTYVNRYRYTKYYGFSVRCLRDASIGGGDNPSAPAMMSCEQVMQCMGDTLGRLNAKIEAQGNTIDSLANSVDSLSRLIPDTPGIPTDTFICGTSTVTDHEGNVYNTVQVGDQCWTKENMRCTTSPSTGTNILEFPASSYTYSGKKAYYPNDNASNVATYGLLYNWNAAVDTFNTSYGETSTNAASSNAPSVTFGGNRRGICPVGWHVPSDAEWTQLTTYVGSQSEYVCYSDNTNIAKALASTTGWSSNSNDYVVPGNDPSTNNATGFSAVPAGGYGGSYGRFGNDAYFWSATQNSSSVAYYRYLDYGYADVSRDGSNKYYGFSVRCLRD